MDNPAVTEILPIEIYSASSDETRTVEVEEEQRVERLDSSAGMRMEQTVWSLVTEEEPYKLSLSDWLTGQYSRTGQASSL